MSCYTYSKMSRLYRSLKRSIDPIMRLNGEFSRDPSKHKINLVLGAYRTEDGTPYTFKSVAQATRLLAERGNFEYLPITGDPEYNKLSKALFFGSNETRYGAVQSLSGTGALRLAGDLISQTTDEKTIYVSNPTWGNHPAIFSSAGLNVRYYRYLTESRKFCFDNLLGAVSQIPRNSCILLHACAHNPTGYDLTYWQWNELVKQCITNNLLIVVDTAYLGFASGDLKTDLALLDILKATDYPSIVCISYAKNFGLYSKRVGNIFYKGETAAETENMTDVLRFIIRTNYSSPPSDGSDIVKTILGSECLRTIWNTELRDIADRYSAIRTKLRALMETKANRDFSAITTQRGMFYYGAAEISERQALFMRDHHVYFLDDGRISLAGLNDANIERFTDLLSHSYLVS
jgi:aspartate/tyrosine/aromatic aminotransferase